jgi:hypothetical protein
MKFSHFVTDQNKEIKGVEVQYPGTDLVLIVGRITNPNYENHLSKLTRPHIASIRKRTIDPVLYDNLVAQAMSHHVLLGWKNLEDDNENAIPYSQGKAYELLTSSKDFFRTVQELASDVELFRRDDQQEVKGN